MCMCYPRCSVSAPSRFIHEAWMFVSEAIPSNEIPFSNDSWRNHKCNVVNVTLTNPCRLWFFNFFTSVDVPSTVATLRGYVKWITLNYFACGDPSHILVKNPLLICYACKFLDIASTEVTKTLVLSYVAMWFNILPYRAAPADLNVIPLASYFTR